jgi:hypothetical protein
MFINNARNFPEGAVLNLRFRLELTGAEVQTRGEVRYCLPGVGAGVEFIRMPDSAIRAILAEIESASHAKPAISRRTHPNPPAARHQAASNRHCLRGVQPAGAVVRLLAFLSSVPRDPSCRGLESSNILGTFSKQDSCSLHLFLYCYA